MTKQVKYGDIAPEFNVKDVMGKAVSIKKYHPNSVLVVFLRYSGCPWCNLALHRLTLEYELLKKNNCNIVAFIQSNKEDVVENIYKRHDKKPLFPIIADRERAIYDLYAVSNSISAAVKSVTKIPYWIHAVKQHGYKQTSIDGNLFLVPAMFLVSGRTGKILLASYGKSFYEHETFTKVYEQLGFID